MYEATTGKTLTVGALSAVENGLRGASDEVLDGLELTLGLKDEGSDERAFVCDYEINPTQEEETAA